MTFKPGDETVAHTDAGRYAGKHGPGVIPDETIAKAVREKTVEGEVACADAERIAAMLGVTIAEIGRTLDLMEIRIYRCRLGLFGYPEGKIVRPATEVDPDFEAAIREGLIDGRLPCKVAWEIAEKQKVTKMEISSVCEALKIKIKPCQLGAF
jgi:hypothetical protein